MDPSLESSGAHEGFMYAVISMPLGHRCGYIRIPNGHPWFGKHYDDIEAEIHGGLTFSRMIDPEEESPFPEPGFWIGFDCAHWCDAPDYDEMSPEILRSYQRARKLGQQLAEQMLSSMGLDLEEWQKAGCPTIERKLRQRIYVEGQCKQLAAQAAEAANR
jgi:hypothetical protein